MKCPKCGYLGVEQVARCRNCGYEVALSTPHPVSELSLKEPKGQSNPLEDLSFLKEAETHAAGGSVSPDLPLFEPIGLDDAPLIMKPSPRDNRWLVRRATPEMPRLRSEPRAQSFDLAFDVEPAGRRPRRRFRHGGTGRPSLIRASHRRLRRHRRLAPIKTGWPAPASLPGFSRSRSIC
jgi:hypothetical protein